jgi:cellulose synthase/poly-beta-1,6-N-acetylglucosamine synthase-like glycosyltransferase
MISMLNREWTDLEWINGAPSSEKKVALLIPQYNEASNTEFRKRLCYFKQLSEHYSNEMDVIIIDDGSTDNSLQQIEAFINCYPNAFFVASVYPNAEKVGALFLTILNIDHEFVILSDFDTDLVGLHHLFNNPDVLNKDPLLMGCYFRMVPHEGKGSVFLLQQLEYSFARAYYRFHKRESSVPVMPGAGSCYKREVLLQVYYRHSGLRNGEDRETTLIGLGMGYKSVYKVDVGALTRPPISFRALIVQRRRWYLGYIETFAKERKYYMSQISRFNRLGLRTLQDVIGVILLLLIPLELIVLFLFNYQVLLYAIGGSYLLSVTYYLSLLLIAPVEVGEIKRSKLIFVLLYPIFWLIVAYWAWLSAFRVYNRNKVSIKKVMKRPSSGIMNDFAN